MSPNSMNQMMAGVFAIEANNTSRRTVVARSRKPVQFKNIAEKNKEELQTFIDKNNIDKSTEEYLRSPTAEELKEMHKYGVAYRKQFPKASKREVRKAIQEKFKIRIFR